MAEAIKLKGGAKGAKKQVRPQAVARGSLVFGRRNVLLLLAGIVVILVGYIALGNGSMTAAPILLVLGYCVIIPLSIVLWARRPAEARKPAEAGKPEDTTPPGTGE